MSLTTEELLQCFTKVPSMDSFKSTPSIVEAALLDPSCSSVSTILVLYTGGTIGMRSHGGVYEPEADFLVNKVMSMSMFRDKTFLEQISIHVEYYGRRSSTHDGGANNWPIICMPPTTENRRILFSIAEYRNLLDSSNCTMDNWIQVAQHIKLFYEKFDGFIVLHGTDTLAYAASFLSFILEGLQKPVIVTGSQIPIGELRSDGRENLLGSLLIAACDFPIPEVSVYFNNRLFRGNRAVKCSATELDAFTSPNYPPLAEMGVDINILTSNILKTTAERSGLVVHHELCRNVVMLRIFPSITTETVQAFFKPPVEGVILQSYGAGNVPAKRPEILEIFKEGIEKHGIIIVNTTQCWRGSVQARYSTGAVLEKIGVIPGYDMTPETALAKVAYVLGRCKDYATRRRLLAYDLRGEMTLPAPIEDTTSDDQEVGRTFDLQGVSTGQVGIAQLVGYLGSAMTQAGEDGPSNVLADRLLPYLLCAAAEKDDLLLLRQLHEITNTFELSDHELRTPLHIAATYGNMRACKFLLENGASTTATDRFGYTPLVYAVRSAKASTDLIVLLRDHGTPISPTETTSARVINVAAMKGKIDHLKLYKLAGRTLQELDLEGRAALHVAVAYRQVNTVRYLIDSVSNGGAGVDPGQKTSFGSTAYDEAVQRQLNDIIAILKPLQPSS